MNCSVILGTADVVADETDIGKVRGVQVELSEIQQHNYDNQH